MSPKYQFADLGSVTLFLITTEPSDAKLGGIIKNTGMMILFSLINYVSIYYQLYIYKDGSLKDSVVKNFSL